MHAHTHSTDLNQITNPLNPRLTFSGLVSVLS